MPRSLRSSRSLRALCAPFAFALPLVVGLGCSSSTSGAGALGGDAGGAGPVADASTGADASTEASAVPDALRGCTLDPGAPAARDLGSTDPTGTPDAFTMDKALEGFPDAAAGTLTAAITTEKGTIVCRLNETDAPISSANFVGLARGTRPYRASNGTWKTGRFYDGKLWHRVIPDFVIQGGDPLGTGTGGPGNSLPEENHAPEVKGALAMAASNAPSGSQFYIVIGTGPSNDYNVFGSCETEVATAIAAVEVDANDRPKSPLHMQRIDIARCP
jgi:peptidyl-prolyl cis-trans isomerase A (cyclophilin A)